MTQWVINDLRIDLHTQDGDDVFYLGTVVPPHGIYQNTDQAHDALETLFDDWKENIQEEGENDSEFIGYLIEVHRWTESHANEPHYFKQ